MVCTAMNTVGSGVKEKEEKCIPDNNNEHQKKKSTFRRLASTRGLKPFKLNQDEEKEERYSKLPEIQHEGWLRVYSGPEPFADMKNQLIFIQNYTNVASVMRKLSMSSNFSIWIQYGGGASRRLNEDECPLKLQDDFLMKCGFDDLSCRSRMGIDPELRFLVRIHGGPAQPPSHFASPPKSAPVQVLKGLVFPNWKRRPVAIVDTKLLLYPGYQDGLPEVIDISGGQVELRGPRSSRLVLRVTPPCSTHSRETLKKTAGSSERHVFLGFHHYWERNLWFAWIKEVSERYI